MNNHSTEKSACTVQSQIKCQSNDVPLFIAKTPKRDQYLFNQQDMKTWDDICNLTDEDGEQVEIKTLHIAVVKDTEFHTQEIELEQVARTGLTTQIKGIHQTTPKSIFAHDNTSGQKLNQARKDNDLTPFPVINSDFHIIDYLRQCGLEAEIKETRPDKTRDLPILYVTMYAHFAQAELFMVCSGSFKTEIKEMVKSGKIQSRRRVIIHSESGTKGSLRIFDWVQFAYHSIIINGVEFALRLRIIDTCALHGVGSYGEIAKAVGHKLAHKDNFTSAEKSKMLETACKRPQDFENYALGDLDVYEILAAYDKQWQEVHARLGLQNYYQAPKLTIGGTVKDLFLGSVSKHLGIVTETVEDEEGNEKEIDWKFKLEKVLDRYLQFNPGNLRELAKNTKALLTKVEGGRCRNNRPTDIFVRRKIKGKYDANLICDIDISGCYGEGQRNQLFAIGNPLTFGFDITKYSENDYPTLRQTLKMFDVNVEALIKGDRKEWKKTENLGELIPGLWYWRITVKEDLKYPQDFFASWFTDSGHGVDVLAKFIKTMGSDTEFEDLENSQFDEEYGNLKIFNHQIHNAVLTHDGLQWILSIASARQRNELLDKIVVLSGALYPRSERIECNPESAVEELNRAYDKWEGKNTLNIFKENGKFVVQNNQRECHAWYAVNMGELIVDKLLIERKKAQKTEGKKSPLDLLFKLAVNTLYGDMVSKFFTTSNPIVGNNITARARALAWYMEKGLHGMETITDGCAFEPNGVMHPKRDAIDGESINQHRKDSKLNSRNQSRVPLGNAEEILGYWVEKTDDKGENYHELNLVIVGKDSSQTELIGSKATEWIDQKAMEHLQNLFPSIDVLQSPTTGIRVNKDLSVEFFPRTGQFSFETKDVFHSGAFHGSANYLLVNPNNPEDKPVVKARGYELKREHESYLLEDSETLVENNRYGEKNNPAKDLLKQLLENAKFVQRQDPAIKQGILKIGDYAEIPEKYEALGLEVGDNIKKCFLMQEFSLTQFTFKTYEQYRSWKKAIESYKDKGKQSLECYFENPDKSINFVALAEWVDEAIANNVMNPFKALDPSRHKQRDTKEEGGTSRRKFDGNPHPNLEAYQKVHRKLNKKAE